MDFDSETLQYALDFVRSGSDRSVILNTQGGSPFFKLVSNPYSGIDIECSISDSSWDLIAEVRSRKEAEWIFSILSTLSVNNSDGLKSFESYQGWILKETSNPGCVYKWETKDGNTLSIVGDTTNFALITPSHSTHTSSKDINSDSLSNCYDLCSRSKSISLYPQLVAAISFMRSYSALEIDKYCRMKDLAESRFPNIPGVGKSLTKEFVENGIVSYKDITVRNISSQYRSEAREHISEQLDTGKSIRGDSSIKDIIETYCCFEDVTNSLDSSVNLSDSFETSDDVYSSIHNLCLKQISQLKYKFIELQKSYKGIEVYTVTDDNVRSFVGCSETYGFHKYQWLISAIDDQFEKIGGSYKFDYTTVNDWGHNTYESCNDLRLMSFATSIDSNEVQILLDSSGEGFIVSDPLETECTESDDKFGAILSALESIYTYSEFEYDRRVRLKEVAEEQFATLDHLIEWKDPVEEGIYTFTELLANIQSFASPKERTNLREEIQEQIELGESPEDSHKVKQLSAKRVADKI